MEDKRLFLLDAFALIYRAYYAFIKNPIKNSKGKNTSAIYGFTLFLIDLLEKEKPSHLAVVFDSPGETDRAAEHSFYKANREAMPEDIGLAIPYIKEILKAYNIPMLELAGYEADDIVGTIAKEKEKSGHIVYMVTPDKDFAQLVSDRIFIYKPSRQGNGVEILGVPEVLEKWEISDPKQVIDILGMWGDAVDNIPGIPGIGEKTAKKLIAEYGSMENMLEHAHELKGKMRENVEANVEQALISKMLATIILDAPIEVSDEDLLISEPDKQRLAELFAELEFRNIGRRILGDDYSVNQKTSNGQMDLFATSEQANTEPEVEKGKDITNTEHNYTLIKSEKELKSVLLLLSKNKRFAFDTETTGLDVMNETILGISFSCHASEAFYLPLSEENREAYLAILKPIMEDPTIAKVGQNIKYDMHILANHGIHLQGELFDTMLAHYLLEPDLRHNMDYLAESYLGYSPIPIEDLIGKKGKNQASFQDVDLAQQTEYAAEDADITWQLMEVFTPLCKEQVLDKLLMELEMPLVPVLTYMERNGVNLDENFLLQYGKELNEELILTREQIFKEANTEFNMDSPKQLGEVLFDQMGIPYKGKKTKTGQYATGEDALLSYQKDYPIVDAILEYRQIAKLKSTYVDALPKLINPNTGRVHTTFSQAVASTGRLSSVNPNLQNIPIRTERGRKVRKAFIAGGADRLLLAADYSQIELRLIAELSGDQAMLAAFQEGLDIHTATAAKVFDVDFG
ncbi:MAG: DNA polymerase I [Chitinophagales bacterium]